ncbi:protein YhfH [Peribacillus frigoritolerans]|nr:protein YhfH [Peribacillus frigoritolerans]MCY8939181.1 YhfH family protein [Peribacillus frigoritolerans]
MPPKQCSECGTHITEQAESYLMECDHCLSKRED